MSSLRSVFVKTTASFPPFNDESAHLYAKNPLVTNSPNEWFLFFCTDKPTGLTVRVKTKDTLSQIERRLDEHQRFLEREGLRLYRQSDRIDPFYRRIRCGPHFFSIVVAGECSVIREHYAATRFFFSCSGSIPGDLLCHHEGLVHRWGIPGDVRKIFDL